jgi:hypothetical protein
MGCWSSVGGDSFEKETYGDARTSGNKVLRRIARGRTVGDVAYGDVSFLFPEEVCKDVQYCTLSNSPPFLPIYPVSLPPSLPVCLTFVFQLSLSSLSLFSFFSCVSYQFCVSPSALLFVALPLCLSSSISLSVYSPFSNYLHSFVSPYFSLTWLSFPLFFSLFFPLYSPPVSPLHYYLSTICLPRSLPPMYLSRSVSVPLLTTIS